MQHFFDFFSQRFVLLFCEVRYGESGYVGEQKYWEKHEVPVYWQVQTVKEYDYGIMSHKKSVRETCAQSYQANKAVIHGRAGGRVKEKNTH